MNESRSSSPVWLSLAPLVRRSICEFQIHWGACKVADADVTKARDEAWVGVVFCIAKEGQGALSNGQHAPHLGSRGDQGGSKPSAAPSSQQKTGWVDGRVLRSLGARTWRKGRGAAFAWSVVLAVDLGTSNPFLSVMPVIATGGGPPVACVQAAPGSRAACRPLLMSVLQSKLAALPSEGREVRVCPLAKRNEQEGSGPGAQHASVHRQHAVPGMLCGRTPCSKNSDTSFREVAVRGMTCRPPIPGSSIVCGWGEPL